MEAAKYIDTNTAADLLQVHPNTVRSMIDRGEIKAQKEDSRCGRGGKALLIDLASLPLDARLKYIASQDTEHPIPGTAITTYKAKYGDKGMRELWRRHEAVMASKALELENWKQVTAKKHEYAAKIGITPRTLYRWSKAYDASGLAGLMDKVEQSNKGQSKSMCLMAQDVAKQKLFVFSRRSNKSAYVELCKLADELGTKACKHNCAHCEDSYARRELAFRGAAEQFEICDRAGHGMIIPKSASAFNAFAATVSRDEIAFGQCGRRYWEAHFMPKTSRMKPSKANECWFGDHHMFDCFVIDDDGAIVRPWMTAWSDAASGCFVSYCITTNPNSSTIAETFVRAIPKKPGSDFYGVPALIYIDNGKDYRSKKFEGERVTEQVIGRLNESLEANGIIKQLGVAVIHAQPYKAWSKTIERLFGTLEERYIREVPGWCGGRPDLRPEDLTTAKLNKMAERGQLLTLRQFEKLVREQIIPQYHAERFSNQASPIEVYRSLERARDEMPSWDVLDLIRQEICTRKISTMGIKLNNELYWHDDLRRRIGQWVTVRFNKDDDTGITVIHDKKFLCYAERKQPLAMVNADPEKLAAHMELQRRTRREVADAVNKVNLAVEVGLKNRNVVYESLDLSQVGYKGETTTEYRRAAKAKREAEKERQIREGVVEDAVTDKVRKMFIELGSAPIDQTKNNAR